MVPDASTTSLVGGCIEIKLFQFPTPAIGGIISLIPLYETLALKCALTSLRNSAVFADDWKAIVNLETKSNAGWRSINSHAQLGIDVK